MSPWRRGWDSNPREVSLKLISSQPRYDRFDTSPRNVDRGARASALTARIIALSAQNINMLFMLAKRDTLTARRISV